MCKFNNFTQGTCVSLVSAQCVKGKMFLTIRYKKASKL